MAKKSKDPLLVALQSEKADEQASDPMAGDQIQEEMDGAHKHPELEARLDALEAQVAQMMKGSGSKSAQVMA